MAYQRKPKRSICHVVPEPGVGKKWCCYFYSGSDPAGTDPGVDIHPNKKIAVSEAVSWAKSYLPSQVFIHGADGKIQDERTYQDDPNPPPGLKK